MASIIQGSRIGPTAYAVTAADLRPLNHDNIFIKFADDTLLVICAANISTRAAEIDNIAAWAAENNFKLNKSKSKEVLFLDNIRGNLKTLPPPLSDITRESSLKILRVAFSNNLSASDHIRFVVSESAQTLYALPSTAAPLVVDLTLDYTRSVPGSRSVKAVRINGVARVRHCELRRTSSELTPSSAAASVADFCGFSPPKF